MLMQCDDNTFGIRITWDLLEATHGKGPCDGVGGALKSLANCVIKSKECGSIQMAEEFIHHVRPQTKKIKLLLVREPAVLSAITTCPELGLPIHLRADDHPSGNGLDGHVVSPANLVLRRLLHGTGLATCLSWVDQE